MSLRQPEKVIINNIEMIDYRYIFARITFVKSIVDKTGKSDNLYLGKYGMLTDDIDKRICNWIIK